MGSAPSSKSGTPCFCVILAVCSLPKLSVVARNNNILKSLVLDAKKEYEKDAEHRVHIFLADTYAFIRFLSFEEGH